MASTSASAREELAKLSDTEVVALAQQGKESAYRELLTRYERPVFSLIFRMVRDRETAEDLAQETFVKVLNNIDRYSPDFKFSSWLFKIANNLTIDHLRRRRVDTISIEGAPDAVTAESAKATSITIASADQSPLAELESRELGQAIERAIADKARVIRIPVHVNEKIKKISRVSRELGETLGRKPSPQEIAKKLRMPVAKVEEILGVVQEPQALEDLSSEDDGPGLLRFVADPNAPSPLERTVDRELREKIEGTLRVLNPREEEIVRLRFGIGRDMPYTLEEIGRVMGLSRERVRQIEATALKKIQSAQECRDLREFLA